MNSILQTRYKARALNAGDIPPMPSVLAEVDRLLASRNVRIEQVAKAISKDQALSAIILRLVNSPIYGFSYRIASLLDATILLGTNLIRCLVVSKAVLDIMNREAVSLWEHSLACSLCCSELALITEQKNSEVFFIAGLLHDIGKAIIAMQLPEAFREINALMEQEHVPSLAAETKILGIGHTDINLWVAEQWRLPQRLAEGILFHHTPASAQTHPKVAAVVHIGDHLAHRIMCSDADEGRIPELDPSSMEILGLSPRDLERALNRVSASMPDLFAIYRI